MFIALRLFSAFPKEPDDNWWSPCAPGIVGALETIPVGRGLHFFGEADSTPKEATSTAAKVEIVRGWSENSYEIAEAADGGRVRVEISLRKSHFDLLLLVTDSETLTTEPPLIEQLTTFGIALHEALHDSMLMGPAFHVTCIDCTYPQPLPPRLHPHWERGTLVDFLSREFRESRGDGDRYQTLASIEVPEPFRRRIEAGLVVMIWVDDLTEVSEVETRLGTRDRFLGRVLDLPRDADYNELGHHSETPGTIEPRPPLTFYDFMLQEGYKGVVPSGPDVLGADEREEIRALATADALPDGAPLRRLHLIAPSFEAARRLEPLRDSLKVGKILYADDDGRFWNPAPEGRWLAKEE